MGSYLPRQSGLQGDQERLPLSTPPTPLLDEPMPSPQKPSPAKERLQTVTEEVEVVKEVTVKKGRRKVQSRSDLLAQALEQARITSPAIAKSKAKPSPAPAIPESEPSPAAEPPLAIPKPKPVPPKKKAAAPPKVPIAPLAIHPGDGCPGRYTQTMQQVVKRLRSTAH